MEQSNYDFLQKLIKKAETDDEVIKICTLGTIYQNTGIRFTPILPKETNTIHYFEKNLKLSFKQSKGEVNKLIIGDNYHALQNLLITHRHKIEIIYIDPPYGCDDIGGAAKQMGYENEHITREDLLSILKPRLLLAQQLLTKEGVIFCSIDDRNQAYVKCLFDDVFGEKNFISCLPRTTSTMGKNDEKRIATSHDYVLIYGYVSQINRDESAGESSFTLKDKNGFYHLKNPLDVPGLPYTKTLDFPIKFNNKIFYPIKHATKKVRWRWGKELVKYAIENDLIVEKNNRLYTKVYKNLIIEKDKNGNFFLQKKPIGGSYKTQLLVNKFGNRYGDKELVSLGIKNFKFSKPVELIKQLIKLVPNNNESTILDFYAGSGTTAQAVLELNKEDNGKRKFILVNINEQDNNIANNITFERCKRIMTGKSSSGEEFDWIKTHKPLGGSLDVFDIKEISSFDKNALKIINEENYEMDKFNNVREKIEWICQNFDNTTEELEK